MAMFDDGTFDYSTFDATNISIGPIIVSIISQPPLQGISDTVLLQGMTPQVTLLGGLDPD
jgi:hypothetical protein